MTLSTASLSCARKAAGSFPAQFLPAGQDSASPAGQRQARAGSVCLRDWGAAVLRLLSSGTGTGGNKSPDHGQDTGGTQPPHCHALSQGTFLVDGPGEEPMCNWTAWCTQNVLLTAFLGDTDQDTRRQVFRKAARSLDFFLKDYGEDGSGCKGRGQWGQSQPQRYGQLHSLQKRAPLVRGYRRGKLYGKNLLLKAL